MSYQSAMEDMVSFARIHELEINGLSKKPDIAALNDLVIGRGRQVLAFTDEVYEMSVNKDGNLTQTRSYNFDNIVVFGKLAGFTNSNEQTLDSEANEVANRTIVGFLLKEFFKQDKFYYVPSGTINSIHDVIEATEKIDGLDDVVEELMIDNIDLFALAKQVSKLPSDELSVAITKAYIQSVVIPSNVAKSVTAKRFTRINNSLMIQEPTTQHIDDEYKLSIVINSAGNVPTLCFEQQSDDGKTSNHIVLDTVSFTGYQKP